MKYRPVKTRMWDYWCIEEKGEIHAFHLKSPIPNMDYSDENIDAMGRAISSDLLHFKETGSILPPCGRLYDNDQKWTGSIVKKENTFYLFYTMREGSFQRIGLALSDDLIHWKEYDGNPVLVPDHRWFITYDCNGCSTDPCWPQGVDCRDMLVVETPTGGYYGYFAVAADTGRSTPVVVIGCAYSEDLLHWEQKGIAYSQKYMSVVEMMDVFAYEGKWYITLLSGYCYGSRSAYSDPYVSKATLYAVADNPKGPFIENMDDNVFIGGSEKSGICCRTINFLGKKRVMYIDCNNNDQTMSLPKDIGLTREGYLRPFYAGDLVSRLRVETLVDDDKPLTLKELIPNSFAWPTNGGWFEFRDGNLYGKADGYSWQPALFDVGGRNLEISFIASVDCREFGILFYSETKNAALFSLYDNTVSVANPTISKYHGGGIRQYNMNKNREFFVRLILIDNTMEVYIENELILQESIENRGDNRIGAMVDSGEVAMREMRIYRLED